MLTRKPAVRADFTVKPLPDDAEHIDLHRQFSAEEYRLLKLGFVPSAPGDDWSAFFENGAFFIHWHATGECFCVLQLAETAGGCEIADAHIHRPALPGYLSGDQSTIVDRLNGIVTELLNWIDLTEKPATLENWRDLSAMPEKNVRLDLNIPVTAASFEKMRWGFIPRVMEDRWFFFMEDNWLHLYRSWTGHCIYQIRFEPDEDGGYRAAELVVNRDPDQYGGSDDYDRNWIVTFLRQGYA